MRIAGIGAYAPRFRLPASAVRDAVDSFQAPGIESVAVPDADEDPVTMAWEGGRRALDAAEVDGTDLGGLFLASTTLPIQDESQAHHLATAFDAPANLDVREFTQSTAAGGEALATAIEAGHDNPLLVVAADAPMSGPDSPEGHAAGAGAAAVVLTPDGPGEGTVLGASSASYPGSRYRPAAGETTGLGITGYDRAAFASALETALGDAEIGGFDAAALTMPDGKRPYRAGGAVGLDTSTIAAAETVSTLGDTGGASALLGLARAVDDGAESALLCAYGSGATCHALGFDTRDVPVSLDLDGAVTLEYTDAMRRRGAFSSGAPAGGGANVTTPTYRRSLPQRYRLDAGVCRACDELVFPPENACPGCGSREGFDAASLSETGTVTATTVIGTGGAPPEFVDHQQRSGPYGTAIIEFEDDSGRTVDVPLQVVLTEEADAPEIGDDVRTVLRVLYDQQGSRRYALKAVPN